MIRLLIVSACVSAACPVPARADDPPPARARALAALALAACDCPAGKGCVCPEDKCHCLLAGKGGRSAGPLVQTVAQGAAVAHCHECPAPVTVHLAWDGRKWSRWEGGKWVPHGEAVAVAPPAPVRQAVQPTPTFLGGGCAGGSCGVPSYGTPFGGFYGGFGGGSCGPGGCR